MSCRVYLVRHGETVWNANMRFQGHADIALTQTGREQAEALAERLSDKTFHAVYSSDLLRAYETAAILAETHSLRVHKRPNLREINFGKWEGLTYKEIIEQFGDSARKWWNNPSITRIPGGEKLTEVAERCYNELRLIVEQHKDQEVLVVAHGGTIRCIVSSVLGINLNQYWRLRLDNTALNIIEFPEWDKGILVLYNDTNHLGGKSGDTFSDK
ncbi:alpha-ribazole phosphatase [Desulfofarcimen acetoxidans DSM 771]|uniref:Alpha-ribazole phosphatase n=1 Tax=Desulfofarcimen acetoxidans (strain ATCC 49208 / DSM 771 / KCTC 5769 / VKM B-1644 / 5575) TaxID=485916 RepID=C8W3Q4_DESAS|nr:alpha-ribazole phosphatase [Desulfofarcimen acetoxidans]ACV63840.1 alpha-ribazole phosphatase [Desulfofarcimen acetoxidans DSM 771]